MAITLTIEEKLLVLRRRQAMLRETYADLSIVKELLELDDRTKEEDKIKHDRDLIQVETNLNWVEAQISALEETKIDVAVDAMSNGSGG